MIEANIQRGFGSDHREVTTIVEIIVFIEVKSPFNIEVEITSSQTMIIEVTRTKKK